MYHLTPETLIRIEDAADPKRGFITKPWGEIDDVLMMLPENTLCIWSLRLRGFFVWRGFRLIHPNAITEA